MIGTYKFRFSQILLVTILAGLLLLVSACGKSSSSQPNCTNYNPTQPPLIWEHGYPNSGAPSSFTLPAESTLVVEYNTSAVGETYDRIDAPTNGGTVDIGEAEEIDYVAAVNHADWKLEIEWLIHLARIHGGVVNYSYDGHSLAEWFGLNPCVMQ